MADIRREARRPPAFAGRDLIALSGVPRHVERSEGGVGGALATSDCVRTDSRAIDQMPEVLVDPLFDRGAGDSGEGEVGHRSSLPACWALCLLGLFVPVRAEHC